MSFSEEYNALPYDVRLITSGIIAEHRIRDLRICKDILRRTYNRQRQELNDLIRNTEKHIGELEREFTARPTRTEGE